MPLWASIAVISPSSETAQPYKQLSHRITLVRCVVRGVAIESIDGIGMYRAEREPYWVSRYCQHLATNVPAHSIHSVLAVAS